jgi:hypothetical protein
MRISPPVMLSSPAMVLSKRGLAAAGRADQHEKTALSISRLMPFRIFGEP